MFTTLELSRAGLVNADVKTQYKRTSKGCLECRARKKKCDQQLPACGGCRRIQTTSGLPKPACTWPALTTKVQVLSTASSPYSDASSSHRLSSANECDSRTPPDDIPTRSISPAHLPNATENLHLVQAENTVQGENLVMPKTLQPFKSAEFSSPAGLRILDFLVDRFESFAYPVYVDRRLTLSMQGLSLAIAHPPLAYAYLACGSALISKLNPGEEATCLSISFQSKALRAISLNLTAIPEEILALAVILLHIYEGVVCDTGESHILHLTGAHILMDYVLNRGAVLTATQRLALEICLYHAAVSSTFNAIKSDPLPDDYLLKRLTVLGDNPRGQYYPLLGVAPELFSIVFHVSQMRRRVPLAALDRSQATEISFQLDSIGRRLFSSGFYTDAPADMVFTAQQYHLACTLLLLKVDSISLRENDPTVQAIIDKASLIMDQFTTAAIESPLLPWPLIVLSCGATNPLHQRKFRRPFEMSSRKDRLGSSLNILRFLDRVWFGGTDGNERLGLDAFFRDDILSTIFF